jgi:HNH endonuclease
VNERDLDRFMEKVAVQPNGCWHWTASLFNSGYGRFTLNKRSRLAHVVIWEHIYGPVPPGYVVDHTCHNADPTCAGGVTDPHRRCVQPDHLRTATHRTNLLDGKTSAAKHATATHCESGHEFTPENTYVSKEGYRYCRECRRIWTREWARKKRSRSRMTEQERT